MHTLDYESQWAAICAFLARLGISAESPSSADAQVEAEVATTLTDGPAAQIRAKVTAAGLR
jgi:hypothetical protein